MKRNTIKTLVESMIKTNEDHAPDIMGQIFIISDEALKDPECMYQFSERIRELREKGNSSQREIAGAIGCNQARISAYENIYNNCDNLSTHAINSRRNYLAAFSLLYEVSPLYLLGLQNDQTDFCIDKDTIQNAMSGSVYDPFSFMIVMKLFNKENLSVIDTFSKICFVSDSQRKCIKRLFRSIPNIRIYIDSERSNLTSIFYNDLSEFLENNKKNKKLIMKYVEIFDMMRKTDSGMYNVVVNMAINIDEAVVACTAELLNKGGYIRL